ncbi:MAG TPA: ROK family protein [Solirubrobacteraceae bacterium]|nr:ROK family protein [Solirubrobacteraceae bacterium]
MSVVGVDLGGTKVAAASLAERRLGEPVVRTTRLDTGDELVDQLAELVGEVRDPELEAVGVGVPSIVDFTTGTVVSSVNVPLADVPLRHVLSDRLDVPVFVDNDATVAALAEAFDEQLRPVARNLVMLTIGTGVGAGLVLGGRIYRGSTGAAGELGHTIIGLDPEGPVPLGGEFPQPGSLESLASGHSLDHLACEAARASPDSTLGRLLAEDKPVRGAEAVLAARAGDEAARRTVEIWAQHVGIGVANAINTFDPDEVVIGGGAALAGDLLLEPATQVARAYVVPGLGEHTVIRLARHGAVAGVLGAAMLAVHELEQPPTKGTEGGGHSQEQTGGTARADERNLEVWQP